MRASRKDRIDRTKPNAGFTLIELLVVISIIAVLASLILPGIMAAHRAARRTQCLSNMKNIGTAMLAFAFKDSGQRLPPSGRWDVGNFGTSSGDYTNASTGWKFDTVPGGALSTATAPASAAGMRYSWCVELLPHLERNDIYDQWDFTVAGGARGSFLIGSTSKLSDVSGGNARGNLFLGDTPVQVLVCPEDLTTTSGRGNLSYVLNGGFSYHWYLQNDGTTLWNSNNTTTQRVRQENLFRMGLFSLDTATTDPRSPVGRRRSLDSIRDGVSTTVMMSENINAGYVQSPQWNSSVTSNWACPHPFNTSFFVNGTAVGVDRLGADPVVAASSYDYSTANNQGEQAPPAVAGGVQGGINGSLTGLLDNFFPYPNSLHSGGVHVVFADGSARFLPESIDSGIWARLITPNGGQLGNPATTPPGGRAVELQNGTTGFTQLPVGEF